MFKKRIYKAVSVLVIISFVFCPHYGFALPDGEQVVSGSVDFDRSQENTLNINQGTNKAIINYNGFSIGVNEAVHFLQPSASSIALNRVIGGDLSAIFGTLTANGKIFLVNPNGILFGPGSHVDTAGLLASTLDISNANFLAGRYTFYGPGGSVVNQGYLSSPGAYIALLGSRVENSGSGIIEANLGSIALAAGEAITLSLDANDIISVVIDEAVIQNLEGKDEAISNTGRLSAGGGKVLLSAKALDGAFKNAINTSGVMEANILNDNTGIIKLEANQRVSVGGLISAIGGKVKIDSEGADFYGAINTAEGIYNMHNGDTNIGGPGDWFIGDHTFMDNEHINIVGDILIDGSLFILADNDDSGSGDLTQNAATTVAVSGNVHLSGANLFLRNIFFGGGLFEATAKTGSIDVAGTIASVDVNILADLIKEVREWYKNIFPIADTYVAQAKPDTNYNFGNYRLKTSKQGGSGSTDEEWILLKFDLSGPGFDGVTITDSELELVISNNATDGAVVNLFHSLNDNWNENTVTWNFQRPLPDGPRLTYDVTNKGDYSSIWSGNNLDNALNSDLGGYSTFIINSQNNGQNTTYYGRETGPGPFLSLSGKITTWVKKITGYDIGALQDGTINLVAKNNINFIETGHLVTAGNVNMAALTGAITNTAAGINVYADQLAAYAVKGIGSDNAITTRIDKLQAYNAESGNIRVYNYGQDLHLVDLYDVGFAVENNALYGEIDIKVFGASDLNYTIDGNLSDWGISLSSPGSKIIGYLDSNLPDVGNESDFWTEDNDDLYHDWHTVGPEESRWNINDAESIYLDNDSSNLYLAVVTGQKNDWNTGDIGIDLDGDGIYEYGILQGSNGQPAQLCKIAGTPIYEPLKPLGWRPGAGGRDRFWRIYNCLPIGPIDFVYSGNQNSHYVMEVGIPLDLLGLNTESASNVTVHWTMSCANDISKLIGDINPLAGVNLIVEDLVKSSKGDISFYADGDIIQKPNGIVMIDQAPELDWGTQIIQSRSHPIAAWVSGVSNDPTIDVEWNLPEQGEGARGQYSATAIDEYIMEPLSAVYTNGGDATITAGNDVILTLIDAQNGDVAITSTSGDIIDGDLGTAYLGPDYDIDIKARTINLSGNLPLPDALDYGQGGIAFNAIDIGCPTLEFSYFWQDRNDLGRSFTNNPYTAVFNPYADNQWWFMTSSPALAPADGQNFWFNLSTTIGRYSNSRDLGPFWLDMTSPVIDITSPFPGTYITPQTLLYLWGDNLSGVDGSTLTGPASGTVYSALGTYALDFSAMDLAGNTGFGSLIFTIAQPEVSGFFTDPKYFKAYYEILKDHRVSYSQPINPTTLYFYHPLSPTDLTAFDNISLDIGAYDFIDDNLKLKNPSALSPFYEGISAPKSN